MKGLFTLQYSTIIMLNKNTFFIYLNIHSYFYKQIELFFFLMQIASIRQSREYILIASVFLQLKQRFLIPVFKHEKKLLKPHGFYTFDVFLLGYYIFFHNLLRLTQCMYTFDMSL